MASDPQLLIAYVPPLPEKEDDSRATGQFLEREL